MAQTYLLPCPCGQKNPVFRSQAGENLVCKSCGAVLPVPTLRGLQALETIEQEEKFEEIRRDRKRSQWSGPRGIAVSILLALSVLFLIPTTYYGFWRSQMDTSTTAQDEIDAGNVRFQEMNASQLMVVWRDYTRIGLADKRRPDFFYFNKMGEEFLFQFLLYGGISLAFAGAALATGLIGRKPAPQEASNKNPS